MTTKRDQKGTNWQRRRQGLTIADDMIDYISKPKDFIRELLQLINNSAKW